jgi:hypothetical protein
LALVPVERDEDAVLMLVAVLEQVTGHGWSFARSGCDDIGAPP